MNHSQGITVQEENDFKKISELVLRNYKLFIISLFITLSLAFAISRYSTPKYSIAASILIKEEPQRAGGNMTDYLNSSLLGQDQNFQNELWVIKSTPIVDKTVRNLDLAVNYYSKGKFNYYDKYKETPFKVLYLKNHSQPVGVKFNISFLNENYFQLIAESKMASFYNYENEQFTHQKENWVFNQSGTIGGLIETPDLAFMVVPSDSTVKVFKSPGDNYAFDFSTFDFLRNSVAGNLNFKIVDRLATVIRISLVCESIRKGIDIVNELMNVYANQKLERKNHTASITIEYIETQLNEISDSLNLTEDYLQSFRSSRQLLNIDNQATEIYTRYTDLQARLAEMVTLKRYYEHISGLLLNDNFSNIMLPSAIGIQDPLLNNLMSQLITAQAQRVNLIENKQERNPLVQKLGIEIENLKKTITNNISAVNKTNNISIDEMNKRIRSIETEISRIPATQRQLGNIERKYRLNDAIYNYLMEKHAEAKITKASNLQDDVVVEPAMAVGQISPNSRKNYLIAFFLGFAIPFGFLLAKNMLNIRIESQNDIESITDGPVLGKILHNRHKTTNVVFEFPKSNIAESFRALRTNLDFYVKGGHKKVIMVTSCLEEEGKSFIALNLAMSYAQLGRKSILLNFDLRKQKAYFKEKEESQEGLSSYMIGNTNLEDIIIKSPHINLDYIPAGILPPNPVELIALNKTEKLITKLKDDYDIIVLDTTPLGQVTDAYLLIDQSEIKIIVVRQNYTPKNVFSIITKDLHKKNVGNLCIVINDNKFYSDQYGYGYGYYTKKGFFNKKNKKREQKIKEYNVIKST